VSTRQPSPCVLYVVGARPNFVKTAPVVEAMRQALPQGRHVVVHTGQHYDGDMSDVFFEELDAARPDHFLAVGSGSHGSQTGRALERIEAVLEHERPDVVVVAGDVNSTLAGALAAAKLNIPIAHVESGLRSFDRTMPEEINRVLVDQVARWCFTHSPEAAENLRHEGVGDERIFFVGNTMIDTLVRMLPRVAGSRALDRLELTEGSYLLVTLHRPTLVDGPLLHDVLAALEEVARTMPVVFPLHPRTRARLGGRSYDALLLTNPLGYVDFLALERSAAGVLTDSGGVQEETTFLGVPCFTLRASTERPVTIERGTNVLLGLDPAAIARIPTLLEAPTRVRPLEGWDGHAAERLAGVLAAALTEEASTPHVAVAAR